MSRFEYTFQKYSLWNKKSWLPGQLFFNLKMKPAPHGIPEPSLGEQGNKRNDDNTTDSKDNGGPGRREGFVEVMIDEQLNADAENGCFRENIKRRGNDGNRQFPNAEGEDLHKQSCQGYNGHGELPEPSVGCGQISDHIQIGADCDAVQKERQVNRLFRIDHCRYGQHKQYNADTDNQQRPQAVIENKQV